MSAPAVSVIVPTYNRADLLPETLASVLGQTLSEIEVIVVDDGSTDATASVVAGMADSRLRYLRNQRTGLPAAGRNAGIRAARAGLLAFVDSDDLWLPEKLERQKGYLAEHPEVQWCFTHHGFLDHGSGALEPCPLPVVPPPGPQRFARLLGGNYVASPTVLARRELIERTGAYDEDRELRFVEDWELWLRLEAASPGALLPEPLALYRRHPANATACPDLHATGLRYLAGARRAVAANPEVYGPHLPAALASLLTGVIKVLLVQGRNDTARDLCRRALIAPLRQPGLALLSALAALPPAGSGALLSLNRTLKTLAGRP
ncbi:MAG: glycosyltransferase family 2 protein [Humidesulfovibrio sp.]